MNKLKGAVGIFSAAFVMKQKELKAYIEKLIEDDCLWKFYKRDEWKALKKKVLEDNHYECAICKKQGKITRYDIDKDGNKKLISTVHHNQYVRTHPELALSRTYTYKGKTYINLIPVCKACHNKIHDRNNKQSKKPNGFVNEERW